MTILLTVKEYFRATYIRFLHLLQIFCQIHLHIDLRLVVLQIGIHLMEDQSLLLIKENVFVGVLDDINLKLLSIVQMEIVFQGHIEIAWWVINTRSFQIIDQQWFIGLSSLFLNLNDLIDLMTPLQLSPILICTFTFLPSFLRKPRQIWRFTWIYSYCFLSSKLLF